LTLPIASIQGLTPLHWAARSGNVDACGALLNKRTSKNGPGGASLLVTRDNLGRTPFHLAAGAGHHKCLEYLLQERGRLSVEVADKEGWLPLHWSAVSGELRCVRALLSAGAKPDAAGPNGMSSLTVAVQR
ncbi:unnamed protein product, partial [Phaeothamnion confervicola]